MNNWRFSQLNPDQTSRKSTMGHSRQASRCSADQRLRFAPLKVGFAPSFSSWQRSTRWGCVDPQADLSLHQKQLYIIVVFLVRISNWLFAVIFNVAYPIMLMVQDRRHKYINIIHISQEPSRAEPSFYVITAWNQISLYLMRGLLVPNVFSTCFENL